MVPDSIRPFVVAVQKFHFWMLAALAPLILLPLLFMAKSSISKEIDSQKSKIEGAKGSVEAVFSQNPHPNENWSAKIESRTKDIEKETYAVWQQLWSEQEPLRQWPADRGFEARLALSRQQQISVRLEFFGWFFGHVLHEAAGGFENLWAAAVDSNRYGPGVAVVFGK